jgi:hypothetical protein
MIAGSTLFTFRVSWGISSPYGTSLLVRIVPARYSELALRTNDAISNMPAL